jgi:hypothetical protein
MLEVVVPGTAEEPQRMQEAARVDAAQVAASRLGGKPLAVPPVEAALAVPASAALVGKTEESLAVVLGAEKPQRDSCIRQAGEPAAEAALAGRSVGGQRPGAPGPSAWEAAGITS